MSGGSSRAIHSLIGVYAIARRTGLLDTAPGRALFSGAYFGYKRMIEDPYAALARSRPELFRGGHILDVGANIGYTATVFARAASEGFRVWAFEPDEFNFRLLQRSAGRRRACGRIVPVNAAVGDSDGTITLRLNPAHHGDHRVVPGKGPADAVLERIVPLVALDSVARKEGILDRIAFIKIDVQGYEIAVCRGMREILAKSPRAVVSLEYMPDALVALGADPAALLAEFPAPAWITLLLGRDGKPVPADRALIDAVVAKTGYVDLLFERTAAQ